ncbi:trna delta -isopentenylpyrophosphate transferase [Methylobacterium sp. NEAU 140]|uniref:trna delta -isopentenylpyrophosphate transferase n=1 Tax=Methylobacterium sp. NEAU 140 TaxID=3064945 RepID=UPI0027344264|nr:trna delta -isopentenylpyrophosphate transferase [Methylobacterium sp. NEAU 140]MDP4023930.1 trna delta -isopentenylpyrophosphate transferase [Methylobacterium sp. NEAU 140]
MRTADKQIADILVRYGEPFGGNVWRVQGTAVIYHKTLERIAAQAGIVFEPPQIIRAERDEAVILVTGRLPGAKPGTERVEWSLGEALVNVNYRVSGKQAAYVYAMAEKRGKDRVILKLIELHGLVYSEEEADEFRSGQMPVRAVDADFEEAPPFDEVTEAEADLKRRIDAAETINAVTDLMLDGATQQILAAMPPGTRDEVRDYAKARLVALGWPGRPGRRKAA